MRKVLTTDDLDPVSRRLWETLGPPKCTYPQVEGTEKMSLSGPSWPDPSDIVDARQEAREMDLADRPHR